MTITAHVVTVPEDENFGRFFSDRHVQLEAIPRVGEYVVHQDPEGTGQAFEVTAVVHPTYPGSTTATVEIRIRHVGTETDLFTAINRQTTP